jgi:nitrite reductase/ring-hydroxylating ferredoxin subunit
MNSKHENRIEQIVSDLLQGRRLKLRGGDAEEKEAITAAARLAAARQGPQRMDPAFRKRLARGLESAPKDVWLTRRAALVAGLGLAAGAVGGGLLGRQLEGSTPTAQGGQPIDPAVGVWVDVAALQDLAEGQGKLVNAGSVSAFVFRQGEKVTAVSSICSHLPCQLWWNSHDSLLDCPCHPASFTPSGQSTNQAYPLPALNTVRVRVTTAGRVEVLGTA